MSKTSPIVSLGFTIIALVVYFLIPKKVPLKIIQTAIACVSYEEKLSFKGTIEAFDYHDLTAPDYYFERPLIFLVPDGSFVKKGDLIAQFDPQPIQLRLETLQEDLEEANRIKTDTIEDWNARVFDSEIDIQKSKENFQLSQIKRKTLNFESKIKQTTANVTLNQSKQSIASSQSKKDSLEKVKETRIMSRDERIAYIKERIQKTEVELKKINYFAPEDSLVILPQIPFGEDIRKAQSGDSLARSQIFARIPHLSTVVLRIKLDERYANLIPLGTVAKIHLPTTPEKELQGRVVTIDRNPIMSLQPNAIKQFQATISVDQLGEQHDFKMGMLLPVDLILGVYPEVYLIPWAFIERADDGLWIQKVAENQQLVRMKLPSGKETRNYYLIDKKSASEITNSETLLIAYHGSKGHQP